MLARRRWRDVREAGQLATGPGTPVHQHVEHRRPRGIADQSSDLVDARRPHVRFGSAERAVRPLRSTPAERIALDDYLPVPQFVAQARSDRKTLTSALYPTRNLDVTDLAVRNRGPQYPFTL
jgi:hypothetical protein